MAGKERAAHSAKGVDSFRAFVVGVVNQSEILIPQKNFQFAGGERSRHASLQSGLIHEWQQNMEKDGGVNRRMKSVNS